MEYKNNSNDLKVVAHYSKRSVEKIFLPLLKELTELQRKQGRRILVYLAAPPATGKTTLASFLKYLSETTEGLTPVCAIGMDGFHYRQKYLTAHTGTRNGKEILLSEIKGAPESFDLPALTQSIKKAAAGEVFGWPEYSRRLHDPVEDAVRVEDDILLLEGNYLLLEAEGWKELRTYADYTIRIMADEKDLVERLIARKAASGATYEAAVEFVKRSDLFNAHTCITHSGIADLLLRMNSDGEYVKEGDH